MLTGILINFYFILFYNFLCDFYFEVATDLEKFCINVNQRQLVLHGPGNPTAMGFLDLPLQLQVADKNPTPGPSSTGLLALPPPEVNRKRLAFRSSEEEENIPPKQKKL